MLISNKEKAVLLLFYSDPEVKTLSFRNYEVWEEGTRLKLETSQ